LTHERPEEFELHRLNRIPGEAKDDFERRRTANLIALLAVLVLVGIGYWVFNALGHSRRFQRCLDSGRSNCVDFVIPAK
jgi:hypothetical protein